MTDARDEIGRQLIGFLPNMRRFGYTLTRNQDSADDLVQAACEKALANVTGFTPGTKFDSWMFRIMRNLWIDQIRKGRTAGPAEDIETQVDLVGTDGEREAHARMDLSDVSRAIATLPDDQREILLLVCGEDMSYKEVSELLGIPIGTVMSRLARARKKLVEGDGINAGSRRSHREEDGHGS
ncbi:RNA polymerase sigma factor [Rhizobium sp. EC-SD404]|uniref:RNA polymerase sigma factor n=1 Tax=Rhizobium sp. EC-SD404 TaxID=2038389 RepID=UPI00125A533F|nr:RNA polymerase sigma factor [Rhizobium sp. EC-SD404]VVT07326.1 RNA polymerase sigma70 factor [Rhizobium sp. EC-SD404]